MRAWNRRVSRRRGLAPRGAARPRPARRDHRSPQYPGTRVLQQTDRRPPMLIHPTLDKLQRLQLTGMRKALAEQTELSEIEALSFEERLGLLVDREITERDGRRLKTRLRQAKLRQQAAIEDIDYRHPRGLDKALIANLINGGWIKAHHNILITGPTGVERPGSPAHSRTSPVGMAIGC